VCAHFDACLPVRAELSTIESWGAIAASLGLAEPGSAADSWTDSVACSGRFADSFLAGTTGR
jgi:hypothetical protein